MPFSSEPNLRTLYEGFLSRRGQTCSWGEHLMRNSGADWLSCTIRAVEQIMERHGFEEDEPKIHAPAKVVGDEPISRWERLLRAARPILQRAR